MNLWTQAEAIELCKRIESVCPTFGCHVALTGGLLYKDGPRKDCDLLFYRIRQVSSINMIGLVEHLEKSERCKIKGVGWCYKASFEDSRTADLFFPEEQNGEYVEGS